MKYLRSHVSPHEAAIRSNLLWVILQRILVRKRIFNIIYKETPFHSQLRSKSSASGVSGFTSVQFSSVQNKYHFILMALISIATFRVNGRTVCFKRTEQNII